jgi:hypothetical protein
VSSSVWAFLVGSVSTLVLMPLAPIHYDETWFLVVVKRVLRGDRLYKDVFFGAGPMPIWVAAAVVWVSRAQLLVMRLLSSVYFIVGLGVIVLTLQQADLDPVPVVALAVGAGGAHLTPYDQYGRWSLVTAMASAAGLLVGAPIFTGLLLGLSISGKYSTGLSAVVAVLPLTIVLEGPLFGLQVAVAALITLAVTVILLGRRGVTAFIAGAVRNKGVYLRVGAMSPVAGIRRAVSQASGNLASTLYLIPVSISYLLLFAGAVAAPIGLVVGLGHPSPSRAIGAAVCLIGLAACYPRYSHTHVLAVAPPVAMGVWLSLGITGAMATTALIIGCGCLVASLAGSVVSLAEEDVRWDVPGMRLLPVKRVSGVWPDATQDLVDTVGSEVFLLHPYASAFYLSGSLYNPTPYDYPMASTFGPDGQTEVIDSIRNGRIRWVCHQPMRGPSTPVDLQDFVSSLAAVAECGLGRVVRGGVSEIPGVGVLDQ